MTIPAHLLNNPLVNPPALPYGAPAFALIKPEHIEPAVDWALAKQTAEIDAIRQDVRTPDFANTSEALEFAGADLSRITSVVSTLFNSKTNDELRDIQKSIGVKLQEAFSDIFMDDVLFARMDAVYTARATLNLTSEENRLLELQHKSFLDSGVNLDPAKKQRMREINERQTILSSEFRDNESKSTAAFSKLIDDIADLDGVPQKNIDKMAQDAIDAGHPGKWLVTFDPSPVPILQYCTNRALRQEVSDAYNNTAIDAPYDNRPLALEILKLSHEAAQIQGYATYADMNLDDMMAKNQQNVYDLLDGLLAVYKPAAVKYIADVKAFAAAHPTHPCADLQRWDYAFYSNQYKEQRCQFDSQDFEKFLEQDKVLVGLQTHLQKAFGIEMLEKTAQYSTYDPDVRVFEVHRQNGGGIVGLLYFDLYARGEAKNSGAWMSQIRSGCVRNGQWEIPIVSLDMNLMKPVAGQPTYINLDDYITLYHEIGHDLHGLLSRSKYASLAGTNVKRDWVEGPSQFNENFALLKEVMDTFAVHADTGQAIPESLIKAAVDYNYFDAGYAGLRQVKFALMDMKCYGRDPSTLKDVKEIEDEVDALTDVLPPARSNFLPSFTHIFAGGYSAGYYSYKWAEVIDKHLFHVATKNGAYDRAAWQSIETHLYASGNMVDPMDSFIAMTGTKPDPDMLLRHEGLLPPLNAASVAQKPPVPQP